MATINYDELARTYEKNLNSMLRGFHSEYPFLDLWVHDEDDTSSLVNMIESAEASKMKELTIQLSQKVVKGLDLKRLTDTVGKFAAISLKQNTEAPALEVRFQ